jgi:hypothetical protein
MPRGLPARLCGWGIASAGLFSAHGALAGDLPGARLEVVRGPGAEACPDAASLTDALRARLGSSASVDGAPVVIEVEIRSTGETFAATVRASGGKRGVRALSADGPSCDGLSEALVVSLLVLLDRDPERPQSAPQAPPASRGPELSVWVGAGGALTYNLPDGLWGALIGEAGARYGRHALWLGGVFTPEREIDFDRGRRVWVNANGGQIRACTLFFGSSTFRADGCAMGLLLALHGEADGFFWNGSELRPWWLVGGGAELAFLAAPWLAASLSGRVLIAPKKERFLITRLEREAYETSPLAGWLGLSLSAKIW